VTRQAGDFEGMLNLFKESTFLKKERKEEWKRLELEESQQDRMHQRQWEWAVLGLSTDLFFLAVSSTYMTLLVSLCSCPVNWVNNAYLESCEDQIRYQM
jgi:hypothetical protein